MALLSPISISKRIKIIYANPQFSEVIRPQTSEEPVLSPFVLVYNCLMTTKSGLPEQFRPYFWDYTFSRLSITKDKDLIIRRILTSGSWDAVLWLRKRLGDQALREWLLVHHGRGLTARQLRFWGLLYDLPTRQVNQWVKTAQAGVWGKR